VEIDLVPRVVARERMVAKRSGLFWMAGLSAAFMLAASGFYYQQAGKYAQEHGSDVSREVTKLKGFEGKIAEQQQRLDMIRLRSAPYSEAFLGRIYWITTFRELSEAIVDDKIWIVELQPLSGTSPLIEEPRRAGEAALLTDPNSMLAATPSGQHTIDSIQLKGLWRDNTQGGSKVVYSYLDRLRQSKRVFFDLVERDANTGEPVVGADGAPAKKFTDGELLNPINQGTSNDRHAYDFTLRLPLPEGRRIQFTK
jgi:hypothetical protein